MPYDTGARISKVDFRLPPKIVHHRSTIKDWGGKTAEALKVYY